jgi:toxin ParE1/3/4
MGRIIRTDQAKDDLVEILDYLEEHNPTAAARFDFKFEEKFRLLSAFPMMGRSREELAPSLRSSLVSPYVVYYRPLDDGMVLVRVIHSSRDVIRLFE